MTTTTLAPIRFVEGRAGDKPFAPPLGHAFGEVSWWEPAEAEGFIKAGRAVRVTEPAELQPPEVHRIERDEPIAIQFTEPVLPYGVGEVCWVNAQIAAGYIKQRLARRLDPQPKFVAHVRPHIGGL